MSKRGSPALRSVLFKAGHYGPLHSPELQAIYNKRHHEKGKEQPHRVQPRDQLVLPIRAVWRNGAIYDPAKNTR